MNDAKNDNKDLPILLCVFQCKWLRMWLILSQGAVSASLVAQNDTALESALQTPT